MIVCTVDCIAVICATESRELCRITASFLPSLLPTLNLSRVHWLSVFDNTRPVKMGTLNA